MPRLRLAGPLIGCILAGCPQTSNPPAEKPSAASPASGATSQPASTAASQPAASASQTPPTWTGPFKIKPPVPGARCHYDLKDVGTEELGDQIVSAYNIAVAYEAKVLPQKEAPFAFEIKLNEIKVKGRRQDYNIVLNSADRGHRIRVRGGADTLILYEAVEYFAMLDLSLTIYLDENGRLIRLEGGQAVRDAMLAMHPPKPQKDPHYIAKVKERLSDENLAARLWPSSTMLPKGVELAPTTKAPEEFDEQLSEFRIQGLTSFRFRAQNEGLLFERKASFRPSPQPSVVPERTGLPEIKLLNGTEDTTLALSRTTPCFSQAGDSLTLIQAWKGAIDDQVVESQQKIVRTLLWTKSTPTS